MSDSNKSINVNWQAIATQEWIHTSDSLKDKSGVFRYSFTVTELADKNRYTLRFSTRRSGQMKYEFEDSDGTTHSKETDGAEDYTLASFESPKDQTLTIVTVSWHHRP